MILNNKNNITFSNKGFEEEKNGTLEFKYIGTPNNNSNIEETKILIDKFFESRKNYTDMIKNVTFLKTILKNYEEKLFVLTYENYTNYENIEYNNSNISLYERDYNGFVEENYINYSIKYERNKNMIFSMNDKKIIKPEITIIKNILNENLEKIKKLTNIKLIKKDRYVKEINEAYRLFYNETLDFSDENINIKIQNMLYFLNQYNINISYYDYSIYDKPINDSLKIYINGLFPLGKIEENDLILNNNLKRKIIIIGEELRKFKEINNLDLGEINNIIYNIINEREELEQVFKIKKIMSLDNTINNKIENKTF